ncbi:MAG: hypothetical protein LBN32_02330 [Helicobacteraceae bacterium]|nr:hypothetical protein [Helicobacteraceae bacterium]
MNPDNFICFLAACGFFIGVIFAILAEFEPLMFVVVSISMCAIFYMIALAAASFFVSAIDTKAAYTINRSYYETQLDKARGLIDRREEYIRDSMRFIRTLEDEITSNKEEIGTK